MDHPNWDDFFRNAQLVFTLVFTVNDEKYKLEKSFK